MTTDWRQAPAPRVVSVGSRLVALATLGLITLALYALLFSTIGGLDESRTTHVGDLLPTVGRLIPSRFPSTDVPARRTQRHTVAAPQFMAGVTALFGTYLIAARLMAGASSAAARNLALGFAALFQVTALAAPDMLSSDVYAYAFYGRIYSVYQDNPYIEVPAQYPGDPFSEHIFWKLAPSFYGPLWTLTSGLLASWAGENVALAALLFRALAAVVALAVVGICAALLERIDRSSAVSGIVLIGWNPLLVVEAGLNGHNDVVVMLAVALAFAFAVWRRPVLAVGALAAGGLVKVVALLLAPLVGILVLRHLTTWRARVSFVARAGALCAALAVAALAPVWAGPRTFAVGALGAGGDRYTNGLGELALAELRIWFGDSREDTEVPLQFWGRWVVAEAGTRLRAERGDAAATVSAIPAGRALLVVAPEHGRWSRVYDPRIRQSGWVRSNTITPVEHRPSIYDDDADVLARERGPTGSPALAQANLIVRAVGWGGFGLVWVGALVFGTGSLAALARWWIGSLLALYYLVAAWFWPWYLLWGLGMVALVPRSWASRWLLLLSWSVLLIYAAWGFGETDLADLQTYRAVAVFGLPPLILAVWSAGRLLGRRVRVRGSAPKDHAVSAAPSGH